MSGCGPRGTAGVATTVAREWADGRANTVAVDLGKMLVGRVPIIGSVEPSMVTQEIRAELNCSFSRLVASENRGRYILTATASAGPKINAPRLPPKAYDISAKYEFTVDTQRGRGVSYQMDMGGVIIEDRSAFLGTE